MTKYLLLGFNSLVFLFLGMFSSDEITIKHSLPANAAPGSEFIAEFTITKTVGIQFGKLQVDLPAGFTAEEVESKGAQFSVTDIHAKLLWMQFPSENEITVKIKFKVGAGASPGVKSMGAKFLYVAGTNEKKSYEITPHEITISGETQPVTTTTTTATTTTTTTSNETAGTTTTTPTETTTPVTTTTTPSVTTNTTTATQTDTTRFAGSDEPQAAVSVVRTVSKPDESGNYRVEIKINKDGIKGFAKYSDVLPAGLTASKGEIGGGGNFKFAEQKATIIWATLPKEEIIIAIYWIKVDGSVSENPVLSGTFSYLENETTMKLKAEDAVVPVQLDAMAANKNQPDEKTTETNTVTPTNTTVTTNTVTETNTVVATTTTSAQDDSKQSDTDTGEKSGNGNTGAVTNSNIVFHVQIGAYKNAPDATYFKTKYNIDDQVNTDMHQGLTKFMVGKFGEYKESRDYRETVKAKGVKDAFVTAYNAGRRVTVQEALMVVKQKWFR